MNFDLCDFEKKETTVCNSSRVYLGRLRTAHKRQIFHTIFSQLNGVRLSAVLAPYSDERPKLNLTKTFINLTVCYSLCLKSACLAKGNAFQFLQFGNFRSQIEVPLKFDLLNILKMFFIFSNSFTNLAISLNSPTIHRLSESLIKFLF